MERHQSHLLLATHLFHQLLAPHLKSLAPHQALSLLHAGRHFYSKSSHFLLFYEPDNLFDLNFHSATPKKQKLGVALRNKLAPHLFRNPLHAPVLGSNHLSAFPPTTIHLYTISTIHKVTLNSCPMSVHKLYEIAGQGIWDTQYLPKLFRIKA